jgi:hypothetical protein
VPTFVRSRDCAKVGTGIAMASTVARMARAVKDLYTGALLSANNVRSPKKFGARKADIGDFQIIRSRR